MNTQPQLQPPRKSIPSPKDHQPYINLTTLAINSAREHTDHPKYFADQIADQIIYVSFLTLPTHEWKTKFTHATEKALSSWNGPKNYARTIATGVLTPQVEREVLKILPNIDQEKYFRHNNPTPTIAEIAPRTAPTFSLKIAMALCRAWRLDPRWERLTPCAKTLFCWLSYRTYRKDTIQRIKQALSKGETWFPWCLTGIDSLSKKLTYHTRSSTRLKHYEKSQIKRALRQLWDLGFIDQIFQGYKDQGAGKYHVFLNPKMSATFNRARHKNKRT
jgi:hypothetical protein